LAYAGDKNWKLDVLDTGCSGYWIPDTGYIVRDKGCFTVKRLIFHFDGKPGAYV
jgi:hypothetical protein